MFYFTRLGIHFLFVGNAITRVFGFVAIMFFVFAKSVVHFLRYRGSWLHLILVFLFLRLAIHRHAECKR